jgi:hypothetical protein
MKISSTKNYAQFKSDLCNREVRDQRRIQRLVASMEKHGFIPSMPIHVKKEGSVDLVRDGQHRLEAAKHLGIPVLYVVDQGDMNIPEVNSAQKAWDSKDYVGSYAQQGNGHYFFLKQFSERNEIPMHISAALLYGHADVGNVGDAIRSGTYQVKDSEYGETVASAIQSVKHNLSFWKKTQFILAIARVCRVKQFSPERFAKSVKQWPDMLCNQPTSDAFVRAIESVYNYHKPDKVPLYDLARQVMADRNAAKRAK